MKILSLEEASAYLNISETSLSEMLTTGELPAAKISKSWILRDIDLEEYIAEQVKIQTKARKEAYLSGRPAKVKTSVGLIRRKKYDLIDLPGLSETD